MIKKWTVEIISLLFVVLFIYTAVSKIVDYERFQVTIGQSPLLTNMSGFIAIFIPVVEIFVSILLIVPKLRMFGLYASFTLMIMFTAYIIAILNFSERIPCSCGGVIGEMGWSAHLVFNIFFVLIALVGIILHGKEESNNRNRIVSV